MNYYAQGGQAHGLKSLTGHEIQTKDGVPSFGIGGFFQKNVMQPLTKTGMQAVKAVQNVPGIKQVSDISTQAFKPIDQALVGLDKTVGKAIPGLGDYCSNCSRNDSWYATVSYWLRSSKRLWSNA